MLENPTKFPSGEYSMLTVIVNASHAVFYRNTAAVGTVAMPRYVFLYVYMYMCMCMCMCMYSICIRICICVCVFVRLHIFV